MDDQFVMRSLAKVNPKAVVAAYRREHTPEPFIDELSRMPAKRRVELDRKAKPPVSVLAANIARVLHRAFPDRFPKEKQNGNTNRLDNADAFLEGA